MCAIVPTSVLYSTSVLRISYTGGYLEQLISNVQGVVKCSSLAAEVGAAVDLPAACVYQSALLMPDADFSAVSTDSLLQMELAQWLPKPTVEGDGYDCTTYDETYVWLYTVEFYFYMRCFLHEMFHFQHDIADS